MAIIQLVINKVKYVVLSQHKLIMIDKRGAAEGENSFSTKKTEPAKAIFSLFLQFSASSAS
ncbi:hypothetical protein [Desulforhopalus singaporensis]|uniref:hypothetical protein n=1 Tax=Desulforhopalus singaporensis TaxID=91360 RepID=UPI000B879F1F|nr:hypothetical protein [Desulforhopalus singaporensis]